MLSTKDHFKTGNTYRLKVKGWEKLFDTNGDQKKAGVTYGNIKNYKEGNYRMTNGSIQEEDIAIINIYAPT